MARDDYGDELSNHREKFWRLAGKNKKTTCGKKVDGKVGHIEAIF